MRDVTVLAERRARGGRGNPAPAGHAPIAFYFDPCCPFSYLAAERVERRFSAVSWIPAPSAALQTGDPWSDPRVARLLRVLAERRAAELRLPLVWPDHFPPTGTEALRVAVHAVRAGVGPAFALAACRLAFCGGFDLDDPVNLAEAAAAAGIEFNACRREAQDARNDEPLEASAHGLIALGVTQLPALKVGARWFVGESSLAEASAWAHAPLAASRPA
jgi:2-hydroxychromene-2-carboxylate isomerase